MKQKTPDTGSLPQVLVSDSCEAGVYATDAWTTVAKQVARQCQVPGVNHTGRAVQCQVPTD